MGRINYRLFFLFTLICTIVTFFSFNSAFSRDAGTLGNDFVRNTLADMYNIVRFPTHTLFPRFFRRPLPFALGLVINSALYGFVMERIVYLILTLFSKKED